jgi:hypothetical protein
MSNMRKDNRTNNDLQNITHKTKDWATSIPLNTGVNSGSPEGWAVSVPLVAPVLLYYLSISGTTDLFKMTNTMLQSFFFYRNLGSLWNIFQLSICMTLNNHKNAIYQVSLTSDSALITKMRYTRFHRRRIRHWSSAKWTSPHRNVTCSHQDKLEKLPIWSYTVNHNIVLWKCVRLYLFQMKNPQQTKRSHICALFRSRTLS